MGLRLEMAIAKFYEMWYSGFHCLIFNRPYAMMSSDKNLIRLISAFMLKDYYSSLSGETFN